MGTGSVTDTLNVAAEPRYLSYSDAKLGFKNYWYPVMFSRDLGRKSKTRKLLGDDIVFIRRHGIAYAIEDRCPHRSIPLHLGKNEFPQTSTVVCRYHGWVFDLPTGRCVAALTDGPDAPIVGKVRVQTYPVEERQGIVWVWMGRGAPMVPVEEDIPPEFLRKDTIMEGWFRVRYGNWRYAAENGFDSAHAKYLHRDSINGLFRHPAAYDHSRVIPSEDGQWITRARDRTALQDDYPGLGRWPKRRFWRRPQKRASRGQNSIVSPSAGNGIGLHMPGYLRTNSVGRRIDYEWYVPIDEDHYLYVQLLVAWGGRLRTLKHRIGYRFWSKWLFHWRFNGQDAAMVAGMTRAANEAGNDNGPSRLFRPDVSVMAWRKMVERTARGEVLEPARLEEEVPSVGNDGMLERGTLTRS